MTCGTVRVRKTKLLSILDQLKSIKKDYEGIKKQVKGITLNLDNSSMSSFKLTV